MGESVREDLRPLVRSIGWSERELARRLGRPHRTVAQWCSGTRGAPPWLEAWLRRVEKAIGRVGVPREE